MYSISEAAGEDEDNVFFFLGLDPLFEWIRCFGVRVDACLVKAIGNMFDCGNPLLHHLAVGLVIVRRCWHIESHEANPHAVHTFCRLSQILEGPPSWM